MIVVYEDVHHLLILHTSIEAYLSYFLDHKIYLLQRDPNLQSDNCKMNLLTTMPLAPLNNVYIYQVKIMFLLLKTRLVKNVTWLYISTAHEINKS